MRRWKRSAAANSVRFACALKGVDCEVLSRQNEREWTMDIATGLTLLTQATSIVKDLRQIDKGFDLAVLKSQTADLYGTLADVKIALSDARETIHEKDLKIKELEDKIKAFMSGEVCPICETGRLKIVASIEHPQFGFAGVQERTLKCTNCNHSEKHLHDPSGVTQGR